MVSFFKAMSTDLSRNDYNAAMEFINGNSYALVGPISDNYLSNILHLARKKEISFINNFACMGNKKWREHITQLMTLETLYQVHPQFSIIKAYRIFHEHFENLKRQGFNINDPHNHEKEETSISYVAVSGSPALLDALIKAGANPNFNKKDNLKNLLEILQITIFRFSYPAYYHDISPQQVQCIELLTEHGYDPNDLFMKNRMGLTILDYNENNRKYTAINHFLFLNRTIKVLNEETRMPFPKYVIDIVLGYLTKDTVTFYPNATPNCSLESEEKQLTDKSMKITMLEPIAPPANLIKKVSIPISVNPPPYEIAKSAPSIKLETLPPPSYDSINSNPPSASPEKEAPEEELESEKKQFADKSIKMIMPTVVNSQNNPPGGIALYEEDAPEEYDDEMVV